MTLGDRIYPVTGTEYNSAPPPKGSYYNVKEQHLPAPATYRKIGRGLNHPCCCCLGPICSFFASLLILIGIATVVFWIVVQPRAPRFDVENVRISGLGSRSTSSTVNTDVAFQLMVRNPNKHIGIYYDSIHVNVQTSGVTIGDGNITPFYQGHKNTTVIDADLKADGVTFDSDTLARLTGSNANDVSDVPLYVKVDVKARAKVGSWKTRKMTVKAHCNLNVNLTIAYGSQLTHSKCKLSRF